MTHPLIDECAVPMAVHAAEVRRVRATVLHRDRPTEDPAGAPSGMRWRPVFSGDVWMLVRDGVSKAWLGSVSRTTDGRYVISLTSVLPRGRSRPRKTIRGAARALVREVRRG